MPMNPERKAEWVAALRSGEFKQGRGRLVVREFDSNDEEVGVRYCCLGVACELAARAGVIEGLDHDPEYPEDHPFFYWRTSRGERRGECGTLPLPVIDWLGLESDNPRVTHCQGVKPLATLNDMVELDFDEISVLIEEQL